MALRRLQREGPYRVARGSADVQGWRVYDAAGEKLGVIAGLLFEPAALKVRFAIVACWGRQVALPVTDLELDEDARVALARGYDAARLAALPAYRDDVLASLGGHDEAEVIHPAAADEPTARAGRAHPFDVRYGLGEDEAEARVADRARPLAGHSSAVAPTAPNDGARVMIRRPLTSRPVTFMASEPTPEERRRARPSDEPRRADEGMPAETRRPYLPGAPRIEAD